MSYKCISVEEAQELIEKNDVTLLDIRDPGSFAENITATVVKARQIIFIVWGLKNPTVLMVDSKIGNERGSNDYFLNSY